MVPITLISVAAAVDDTTVAVAEVLVLWAADVEEVAVTCADVVPLADAVDDVAVPAEVDVLVC